MHWHEPSEQPRTVKVFHSTERPGLTPVFGTSTPPSGVSGLIRGVAFRYSENDLRHWLMLLFADRVNVVEGLLEDGREAPRARQVAAGALVVGVLAYLVFRRASSGRRHRPA